MKLSDFSVRHPVSVAVGAMLLALFGLISLARLPVQLTPDIDRPVVSVSTRWPGAGPEEVEREIVDKQEEFLKTVEGVVRLSSECRDSEGSVTLEFGVGEDMDAALLRVANALERVPRYPDDADKPVITGSGGDDSSAIAWFIIRDADEKSDADISTVFNFVEDVVKPRFERVTGVARSNIRGGRERELQVIADPGRLASHGIGYAELAQALDAENVNRSGGSLDEGKRRYVLRTVAEFRDPRDVENTVVAVRSGAPVLVRDVAEVRLGFKKPSASAWNFGRSAIAVNAIRKTGANVLETMVGLKAAMDEMNEGVLKERGLKMKQSYDETVYIESAIALVKGNLVVGGLLAVAILYLFLRSGRATLVIATAIPLSTVGTFIAMKAFGRSLNVVSLAGLAFAVGMVVDNAIVVLENIYRHMEMGKSRMEAARDGASEVWGAVLASTLTTAAVFLPVLFIQEEAGQLFRDIALAVSVAVLLSLVVSLTVVPSMAARIVRREDVLEAGSGGGSERLHRFLEWSASWGARMREWVAARLDEILSLRKRQVYVVLGMTLASLLLSWALAPKAEYLPSGNRNLVFGRLLPPPGYNLKEMEVIGKRMAQELSPYFTTKTRREAGLDAPPIENFFFMTFGRSAFMGAISAEPQNARELIPVLRRPLAEVPGLIAIVAQSGLFQRRGGAGRNIDVEITGPDINRLLVLGREVFGRVREVLPDAQARPEPSLDLGNPEIRVVPDRARASEAGLSAREIGFAVDAAVDGVKVSEFRHEGDTIDITLTAPAQGEGGFEHGQDLEGLELHSPSGETVTLGSVAAVEMTSGPEQINRIERRRAVTIQVQPGDLVPLAQAMEKIEREIAEPLRQSGRLQPTESIHLAGAADQLSQALRAFKWNFLLAIIITYLLMSALFEDFFHPLVIMFSVPLGAVGGFAFLRVIHMFVPTQQLDLVTMLGFVILVGTVVNNAILVVDFALQGMRLRGMEPRVALVEAVRTRMRPMFMTTATTVFGMLPLILFPGAGSEIYRGLGSVVTGGIAVSTVFTLFLIPAMFMLAIRWQEKLPGMWSAVKAALLSRRLPKGN